MFLLCRNEEERPNYGTFEKHEAKKIAASSTPSVIDDEQTEDGSLLLACLVRRAYISKGTCQPYCNTPTFATLFNCPEYKIRRNKNFL
jgi:hypothetical protein